MNGNSLLADTNIILYLLNGDETLATVMEGRQVYLSFVTELELLGYSGITGRETTRIKSLLRDCTIIDINARIKENTILIRKKYGLKLPDSIIVATSSFLGVPLLTADQDFMSVKDEINLVLYE